MTLDAEVHLSRVTKWFPAQNEGAEPFCAVDGLSLAIARGEMVALLGKTGCGKSTTFNLIAGLIAPSQGSVRVQGLDPFAKFDALQAVDALLLSATHPMVAPGVARLADTVFRPRIEEALRAHGLSSFDYYTTGLDGSDKTVSMGGNAPGAARNTSLT